jgi:exopolysaccharide biosynthesis protein
MPIKRVLIVCFLLSTMICSLAACDIPSVTPGSTPTVSSTGGTSGTQDQSQAQLNTWLAGGRGVAVRYEDWKSPANNEDIVTIVRFDPHYVKLSVGYQPDSPRLLSAWMQKEHATAIINGGYFNDQNQATALVVSNGQSFGTSYAGFGGMLSVDAQGNISLRSLHDHPYDPDNEQLTQATQSSPMLVANGKATQFNADAASSRRSVVAMDKAGHLLLIVSSGEAFSLGELVDLLAGSDLSIESALNLDGGTSTGLYVNSGNQNVQIDSLARLPLVIMVKSAGA